MFYIISYKTTHKFCPPAPPLTCFSFCRLAEKQKSVGYKAHILGGRGSPLPYTLPTHTLFLCLQHGILFWWVIKTWRNSASVYHLHSFNSSHSGISTPLPAPSAVFAQCRGKALTGAELLGLLSHQHKPTGNWNTRPPARPPGIQICHSSDDTEGHYRQLATGTQEGSGSVFHIPPLTQRTPSSLETFIPLDDAAAIKVFWREQQRINFCPGIHRLIEVAFLNSKSLMPAHNLNIQSAV